MPIGKIKLRGKRAPRPTDPVKIFESRTLRGSVENLWSPQSEALSEWTSAMHESEVIIEMATGGGKTIVGLLTAQSIVNETKGKVLYLCSTNQLVNQTAAKADEIGLSPAIYTSQNWTNRDAFLQCEAPCITSYAAAFNARSIFRAQDVHGLVLDDAHVVIPQLRSQFTLRVGRAHPAFQGIASKLRPYFASVGKNVRFDEAISGDPLELLFVPAHAFTPLAPAIASLLRKNGIDNDAASSTKWSWFHIGEHLDRCFAVLGPNGIEIAPAVPPVHAIDVYNNAKKRLFLTATMPSALDLARVFGIDRRTRVIRPKGKLGAAQRLFAFMQGTDNETHQQETNQLIRAHKACIVVPSYASAKHWSGDILESGSAESTLEEFKVAKDTRRLVLVARFDGIDLPGDSCRVLVLSGLPRGRHLIERVISETIDIRALRASTTATRIVQSIGRIFRSNTDHGAVILCGPDLHDWLKDPGNQAFLPPLLQQQVALGLELLRNVEEGKTEFSDLLHALLTNDPEWDDLYRDGVGQYEVEESPSLDDATVAVFLAEHKGSKLLWDEHYAEAAAIFGEAAKGAEDGGLRAWMHHLTGLAYLLGQKRAEANREFQVAHALQKCSAGRSRQQEFKPSSQRARRAPRPCASQSNSRALKSTTSDSTKCAPSWITTQRTHA